MQIVNKVRRKLRSLFWDVCRKLTIGEKRKDIIVFESIPDMSDNTKAVFDEMIRRKLNQRFKLVWLLYDSDVQAKSNMPNVFFLPHWDAQARYYSRAAKAKIFCNRFLEKEADNQLCIYLSHGSGLKVTRDQYKLPHYVDFCIAASPNLEESHAYDLEYVREKTVGLGFPRNDVLTCANAPIRKALGVDCKKIIVWYPTFRQHASVKYTDIQNPIPLLHDTECAKRINAAAAEYGTLIVIKPHFAQDMQYIREMNLSHIRFIDNRFFLNNNISSYEFVGSCDALVTDYSSIYYDYTLCDKPIALIWEDLEEFTKKHALVKDHEYLTKGGEKIYSIEEFIGFIRRVSCGEDVLKEERREIRDFTNITCDGQNSKRVVDFILKQMNYMCD